MTLIRSAVTGLALLFALAACGGGGGGGGESEADLIGELKDQGFSDSLASCVVDEVKSKAGSLDEYTDLEAAEQQDMAARAGATCAEDASPEEIADTAEGLDAELDDPALRKSIITGMTQSGLSEEVATCILDAAIDEGFTTEDFVNPDKIQPLAATCQ